MKSITQLKDEINSKERQLNNLTRDLNDLKRELESYKPNFTNLSYSQLMEVFHDNEQFYRFSNNDPIVIEWKQAYQVFKNQRQDRDKLIAIAIKDYIENNYSTEIVIVNEIARDVQEVVRNLYLCKTPFDNDKKYFEEYADYHWFNRSQRHTSKVLRETFGVDAIQHPAIIDLRK